MFPARYFAERYFAPRYFPSIGATAVVLVPEPDRIIHVMPDGRALRITDDRDLLVPPAGRGMKSS